MTQLTKQVLKAVLPVAAMAAVGCTSDMPGTPAEQFMEPGEVSHVTRMGDQQIANGARTDATLRPYHFNQAGRLNSLGVQKLERIVDADDADGEGELVLYVDVPTTDGDKGKKLADARHDAVTKQLMELGLTEEQFRLETGHNPDNLMLVVDALPKEKEGDDDKAKAGEDDSSSSFGGGLGDSMEPKK